MSSLCEASYYNCAIVQNMTFGWLLQILHRSDQKKDVIEEKVREERRKQKIKEVEEQYEKEEKDKMALEMYDKWLVGYSHFHLLNK